MKNVVIYSSNTCGYCVEAKKYLDSIGVAYTEKTSAPMYRLGKS